MCRFVRSKGGQEKSTTQRCFRYAVAMWICVTIVIGTEDCKAKARDHRQSRSQRKPLKKLRASEIYQLSFDEDLGVSRHQNRCKMSSLSQDLDDCLIL